MLIEDGKGRGYNASVNSDNQLKTQAATLSELEEAVINGDAYIWCYTGYDYDAADSIMFVRNNDPNKNLVVKQIHLFCDTASKVQVHSPTGTSTPTGTAVTGSNLNVNSGNTALATGIQDETGFSTQGTVLINKYIAANGSIELLSDNCVVLGYHDNIALDIVTAGTMAYGQIIGYFRDK